MLGKFLILVVASLWTPVGQDLILFEKQIQNGTLKVLTSSASQTPVIRIEATNTSTISIPFPEAANRGVFDAAVHEGKVVLLLGSASSGTASLQVFDLQVGTLVDSCLVSRPSLSPDGRYIAFAFLTGRGDESNGSVYLVYDLEKTANENRMRQGDIGFERRLFCGVAIYPAWNRTAQSYSGTALDTGAFHLLTSPIVWPNSQSIIFLEQVDTSKSLVHVDVATGQFRKVNLEIEDIVDPAKLPAGMVPAGAIVAESVIPLNDCQTTCRARINFTSGTRVPFLEFEW